VKSRPEPLLNNGERVGSLLAISSLGTRRAHGVSGCQGWFPVGGRRVYTQTGVVAAGVLKLYFPFPWIFSWNCELAGESARKLRNLKPTRLAVGHGKTIESPLAAMDRAVDWPSAVRENAKLT